MVRRAWAIGVSIAVHAAIGAWMVTRALEPRRQPITSGRTPVTITVTDARVALEPPKRDGTPAPAAEGTRPTQPQRTRAKAKTVIETPSNTGGVEADRGTDPKAGTETPARDLSQIDLSLRAPPEKPSEVARPGPLPRIVAPVPGVNLQPSGGGSYTYTETEFRARIEHDGTLETEDRFHLRMPDTTDTLLRMFGEDPYAYEKRKLMEATRDLRMAMAEEACVERLNEAVHDMRPRLEAIWKSDRSIADKKNKIFTLWDECAEDGSPIVVQTSKIIREVIFSFINEKIPPASPIAYTEGELALLNERRHSREIFTPYVSR